MRNPLDMPIDSYDDVRSRVRPGDVLLFWSPGWIGRMIAAMQDEVGNGPSHVGMLDFEGHFTSPPSWGGRRVVLHEATIGGVQTRNASFYLGALRPGEVQHRATGTVIIARPPFRSYYAGCRAANYARSQRCRQYDYLDLIVAGLHRLCGRWLPRNSASALVCSELVDYAMQAGDVALDRLANGRLLTPSDIVLQMPWLWRLN